MSGSTLIEVFRTGLTCAGVVAIGLFSNLAAEEQDTNSLGMKLRLIEGGRFIRGTDGAARGMELAFPLSINAQYFGKPEGPAHVTWITKPYWIAREEVTVGQWKKFVEATGYVTAAEKTGEGIIGWSPTPEDQPLYQSHDFERKPEFTWKNPGFKQTENHPVVGVSYEDVQAFLKWLSQKEGVTCRLPTEAEWEFACRAGTDTWFSFGDQPRGTVHRFANVGNVELEKHRKHSVERQWVIDWDAEPADGHVFTAPVGCFEANDFGLYDMHGNVWEWCSDLWLDTYYKRFDRPERFRPREMAIDPVNHSEPQTDTNQFRAIRGGCWYNGPIICRSANRTYWDGPDAACYLGFRVVREADPKISTRAREAYESEVAARAAIEKAGGSFYAGNGLDIEVRFEGSNPFDPAVCEHFEKIPGLEKVALSGKGDIVLTTAHLEAIAKIESLRILSLRSAFKLKDADLAALGDLPNLEELDFSRSTSLDDGDLAKLSVLKNLKRFSCYGVGGGLTDIGASQLMGNRHLEMLELYESEVTGSFLNDLVGCPLQRLAISKPYGAGARLTDANAEQLAKFTDLRSVDLTEQGLLTDSTLLVLGELKNLEELNLRGCGGISEGGFEPLGRLKRLRYLNLQDTAAGDEAVIQLAKIPRLQNLQIGSEKLTDSGLRELSKIFSLQDLYIKRSVATDEGLKALGRINRLERLDLNSDEITGAGLGPITRLPNLKDLKLCCPALTDVAFEHLSRGKSLRKIRLAERGVQPAAALTNDGMMQMARATWLLELWLPRNDTGMTEEAMMELKKQMPKTGVIPYTVEWERPEGGER